MNEIEQQSDLGTDTEGWAKRWNLELDNASKQEEKWRQRVEKVLERYRMEGAYKDAKGSKFNILYSNTETLKPAVYSQTPTPDVRRRYSGTIDPQADNIATCIERALSFSMDSYGFDAELFRVRDDYLLAGRAIARVRYLPTTTEVKRPKEVTKTDSGYSLDGKDVSPDDVLLEAGIPYTMRSQEELTYEEVQCEYVNWDDFRLSPAKTWPDVTWVAFRQLLTRDELITYFPGIGADVNLTHTSQIMDGKDDDGVFKKGVVWEVWDKPTRKVYWWSPGYKQGILKTIDDPLKLDGFFPVPEPLYSIHSNDTMIPIPEYTMYQDQAEELDLITTRIQRLVDALRARGLYAGERKEDMDALFRTDEAALVPVADWVGLAEKGGLDGMISWLPIEQFGKVLSSLYAKRQELIQAIYDLTGISDIMRGSSDPRETKGAQQLKAQYGSRRMLPRAREFQYFVRGLLRLKAEIIATHFNPQTLEKMTGIQLGPKDMAVLHSDPMRNFRIDIETDSTVAPYDDQEKQSVTEFLQAMGSFASDIAPLVQMGALPQEAVNTVLTWAGGKFKVSRELEAQLKAAQGQVQAQQQQKQQQEQQQQQFQQQQSAQAQQQAQGMAQADQQHKHDMAQQDMQIKVQKANLDNQITLQKHLQDMKIKEAEAQNQIRIANKKATTEQRTN